MFMATNVTFDLNPPKFNRVYLTAISK